MVYSTPVHIGADAILRFFAIDTAGNVEFPKKRQDYVVINDPGSIASVKLLPDGAAVRLGEKALHLKRSTFGYIQEQNRASGIRVEGAIPASQGQAVCLTGTIWTTGGGERYIQVGAMSFTGPVAVKPVGVSNRGLQDDLTGGLCVTTWGIVNPGSITNDSYTITDGSDNVGIKVVTQGAPTVSEGTFVIVTGAAGFDGCRVIYQR